MHVATRRALLSRRAAGGAWAPTDLASLVAWYDFSDADTLFTDAGSTKVSADAQLIYQANDKSGHSYHLAQATESSRPVYKTGIQNSLSIARFADTGDVLLRATTPAITQPNTIVLTLNSVNRGGNVSIFDSNSGVNLNRLLFAITTGNYVMYSGAYGPNHEEGLKPEIVAAIFNGASSLLYVEGGTPATGNPGTNVGTGWKLGGSVIDVMESIICSAALSTADLNALGGYLAAKWALTWNTVT